MENQKYGGRMVEAIIIVLVLMIAVTAIGFQRYINDHIFEERKNRIIGITEKVCQIMNTVIDTSWELTTVCENVFLLRDVETLQQTKDAVDICNALVEEKKHIVFAFDENGTYYAPGGESGKWFDQMLFQNDDIEQTVFTKQGNKYRDYMIFLKKFDVPRPLQEGMTITHIAVAIELDIMEDIFSVAGFSGNSHGFIVDSSGQMLYCDDLSKDFIHGDNIVNVIERQHFLNGDHVEDLQKSLAKHESFGYELEYEGTPYYVASAPVAVNDWSMMLFVPTEMIGAITNAYMDTAIGYFMLAAIVIILLVSIGIYILVKIKSDQKLIRQQKESNFLLQKAAEMATKANAAKKR